MDDYPSPLPSSPARPIAFRSPATARRGRPRRSASRVASASSPTSTLSSPLARDAVIRWSPSKRHRVADWRQSATDDGRRMTDDDATTDTVDVVGEDVRVRHRDGVSGALRVRVVRLVRFG
jgi:hypothetical protein